MNWKKVVSVLLVSAMALSTAACGGSSESGSNAASGDAVTSGTENGGSAAASGEK